MITVGGAASVLGTVTVDPHADKMLLTQIAR
jgi:hypothetical protein